MDEKLHRDLTVDLRPIGRDGKPVDLPPPQPPRPAPPQPIIPPVAHKPSGIAISGTSADVVTKIAALAIPDEDKAFLTAKVKSLGFNAVSVGAHVLNADGVWTIHATIKRLFALALLFIASSSFGIGLTWNYQAPQVTYDLGFLLRCSTNLGPPASQWPILTNVAGSNCLGTNVDTNGNVAANLSLTNLVAPGSYFFVVQASNMWGALPLFTNVTNSSPTALNISNLNVTK